MPSFATVLIVAAAIVLGSTPWSIPWALDRFGGNRKGEPRRDSRQVTGVVPLRHATSARTPRGNRRVEAGRRSPDNTHRPVADDGINMVSPQVTGDDGSGHVHHHPVSAGHTHPWGGDQSPSHAPASHAHDPGDYSGSPDHGASSSSSYDTGGGGFDSGGGSDGGGGGGGD